MLRGLKCDRADGTSTWGFRFGRIVSPNGRFGGLNGGVSRQAGAYHVCVMTPALLGTALDLAHVAGRPVQIRLTLDGDLAVYDGEQLVASHRVDRGAAGWRTIPAHHAALWAHTLAVEQRPLAVYEEVTS